MQNGYYPCRSHIPSRSGSQWYPILVEHSKTFQIPVQIKLKDVSERGKCYRVAKKHRPR